MKAVSQILLNPLGSGIAIVHWIVAAFAVLGDRPSDPIGFGVHTTTQLTFYLALLDQPALVLTKILVSPIDPFTSFTPLNTIILVSFITLQWLFVGTGISKLCHEYRREAPIDGDNFIKFR